LRWHHLHQAVLLQHEEVELGRHLRETLAAQALYSDLQNRSTAQRQRLESLRKLLKKTQDRKIYAELMQEYNRIGTEHNKTVQQMTHLKPNWFQKILVSVRKELEEEGRQDRLTWKVSYANIKYQSRNRVDFYPTHWHTLIKLFHTCIASHDLIN
jgi:hypothetical protein